MPSRIDIACHRNFNRRRRNINQLHDNFLDVGTTAAIFNHDSDRNRRILFVVKPIAFLGRHYTACRHIEALARVIDKRPGERIAIVVDSFQGIHHRARIRIFLDLDGIRNNLRIFVHIVNRDRHRLDYKESRIVLVGEHYIDRIGMRFGFVIKFLLGGNHAGLGNSEKICIATHSGEFILSEYSHRVVFTPYKRTNNRSRSFMFIDFKLLIFENRIFVHVANRNDNRGVGFHLVFNIFYMNLNIDGLNLFEIEQGRILDTNRTIRVNRNKVSSCTRNRGNQSYHECHAKYQSAYRYSDFRRLYSKQSFRMSAAAGPDR